MTKQKRKKAFLMNFTFILLIVGILLFGLIGLRAMFKKQQVEKEISQLEVELENLNLTKNNFLKTVEDCQSEFFLEQEARTKLNLKKAGETVVVINEKSFKEQEDKKIQKKNTKGGFLNIIKWWEYFFADERFLAKT